MLVFSALNVCHGWTSKFISSNRLKDRQQQTSRWAGGGGGSLHGHYRCFLSPTNCNMEGNTKPFCTEVPQHTSFFSIESQLPHRCTKVSCGQPSVMLNCRFIMFLFLKVTLTDRQETKEREIKALTPSTGRGFHGI